MGVGDRKKNIFPAHIYKKKTFILSMNQTNKPKKCGRKATKEKQKCKHSERISKDDFILSFLVIN